MDRFSLIRMRLQAGLKQWELARLLNMSQTALCDLERGRRPITPEVALRIKNAAKSARLSRSRSENAAAGEDPQRDCSFTENPTEINDAPLGLSLCNGRENESG